MFDFVRKHTRLLQFVLVLLIFPSFVFFGVQGYSRFNDATNDTVAKVDGVGIKRAEWDDAHKRQVDNFRRQAPGIDASMFDTPQLRRETLDGLVRERLLIAASSSEFIQRLTAVSARLLPGPVSVTVGADERTRTEYTPANSVALGVDVDRSTHESAHLPLQARFATASGSHPCPSRPSRRTSQCPRATTSPSSSTSPRRPSGASSSAAPPRSLIS